MGALRFRMRRNADTSPGSGLPGRLFGSVVLVGFVAIPSFMLAMLAGELLDRAALYSWTAVPCRIVRAEVVEEARHGRFVPQIEYTYRLGEQTYTADSYTRQPKRFERYSKAAAIVARYPVGSEQRCYVDPDQPSRAVLVHESLWFGLFGLIPLLFMIIGLGGLVALWRPRKSKTEPISDTAVRPAVKRKRGTAVGVGFFAIFALVGCGALIPSFILPMWRMRDARHWPAVPCKILKAEVQSHSDSDGTTYSVYILYEYEVAGRTYKSDRYDFLDVSSSGYRGKQRIVEAYRKAANPVCYVDPDDPSQAVLSRGFSPVFLFGLIPLVFAAVGIGGIIGVLRRARRNARRQTQADWLPEPTAEQADATDNIYRLAATSGAGQVVLKPRHGRGIKLFGVLFFATFCNSIVWFFVVQVVQGFREGRPEWCMALFMIPFVLVGLGAMGAVVYQFLALFNPRAKLRIGSAVIPLGGSVPLSWEIFGRVERIGTLTITLAGREEAQYRQGTRTYTDKNTFYEEILASETDRARMAYGQTTLRIPADTMHSFAATHNKIVWTITVRGDIARWPDLKDEYEITVAPQTI